MTIDTFRRILLFIVLCLAQALVFSRIHLFHCATPLVYVYFVIVLPRGTARWAALLWSFALGLCIDMFSNTPGLAAASMTLIGMIQPPLLELFLPRDAESDMPSSIKTLTFSKFLSLAAILVFIYCLVFFTIEVFSFSHILFWLNSVIGSMLLTLIMILTFESIRR